MLGTKQIVAGVGMALLLAVGGMSQAMASTSTVSFSASPDFTGGSVNGFTFEKSQDLLTDLWAVNDARTLYMTDYTQSHVITYDQGSFDFTSISLNGLPGPGVDYTLFGDENTLLNVLFRDTAGNLLDTASFDLSLTDEFQTFTKSVANVHSIEFAPLGGNTADGGWVSGTWPRVASITMTSPVPEPETYAMLLLGLAAMAGRVRRRN